VSADLLREAAALMRERAEAATPGPWECYGDHLVWPSEKGPAANDPIAGFGPTHEETATHIASWHPVVALAVADWLEHAAMVADEVQSVGLTYGGTDGAPALAVARAYLGRDT
jgi:hypothetical protein